MGESAGLERTAGLSARRPASRRNVQFKASADELEAIDARARARGLTRTRYLISMALNSDPHATPSLERLEEQVAASDQRLGVLESQMIGVQASLNLMGFDGKGDLA